MMKSPQGGNPSDPRGIEMESVRMIDEHPYRSRLEEQGLRMRLVDGQWLPSVVYLQNNVSPTQNKTHDRYTSLKPKGIKQKVLLYKASND
jgi:hypothetical protein